VRIFKTSEEEKIRLLYHFFEKEDKLGISFDDFIVVVPYF
jgi:predicted nucleic acid-binding protein